MRAKKRPGLTLIEVALSLAIVGIAVVPAATMWVRAAEANRTSERQAKSLILAQLIIESRVRVVPFEDQKSESGTDGSGLRYDLVVTSDTATLKRARVTVYSPPDTAATVELETLTAKEI